MSNQVDLTPGTAGNSSGLHVHVPNGNSACSYNNAADFPSVSPKVTGTAVMKNVSGVRFSNPS